MNPKAISGLFFQNFLISISDKIIIFSVFVICTGVSQSYSYLFKVLLKINSKWLKYIIYEQSRTDKVVCKTELKLMIYV